MADLADQVLPVLEPLLDPGEHLEGACIATQSGLFRGRQVLIGVSDRRLIVQGMTRRFERDGDPLLLPPERIAKVSAGGAGGSTVGPAIVDTASITVKLRTTDGEKLKLMLMRGTGPLGRLGGGDFQRTGVEALAAWLAARGL